MFPEVLEASAELAAAQREDGVASLDRPMHASPFGPGANHAFATSFHHSGRHAQNLGAKFPVLLHGC